ncbi:hypothetical protein [Marinobacter adhaerens]|uniref:hypothetical protein n=1 Tax=Marinobacter adhaerens TaxID=1033846 RepID=UPI003D138648
MFELASLGIGYGSLLMLLMLIVLLLTGMQLAFATGLVALVFALAGLALTRCRLSAAVCTALSVTTFFWRFRCSY